VLFTLIVFILMYVLMLIFSKRRMFVALGAAVVLVVAGMLSPVGALRAIDWNVILMIGGTMGIVSLFIESGMPERMGQMLLRHVPNACWAVIALSLFSGFISAFVDNVATLLMLAPVGMAISKELKLNPIPVLISISVSSNLQGAATLVGDTTSIMLGGYANMDFTQFIFWHGKPSIFFAVELGALATIPVLLWLFRKDKAPIPRGKETEVTDYFPTVLMVGVVVLLIAASFIPDKPHITNGLICVALCVIGLVRAMIKRKSLDPLKLVASEMDYQTLVMLAGLFIVIAAVSEVGIIDRIADIFSMASGSSLLLLYILIVGVSVILSAFIDNIPYVAAMLPVVSSIAASKGIDPIVFYFGLLTGATLGGNITPFGASANITAIGILRKEGYDVRNRDFFRIGLPFTFVAVVVGAVFIWLVWA
jgi:Na+/H+ antiporter NhaD/arsenite permease-like protein